MLQVIATFTIKKEKIEEAITVMNGTIAPTREEDGNVSYYLYKEIGKENVFTYIEQWKDKESLDSHLAKPHMVSFIEQITPLQEVPFSLHLLENISE